MREWRDNGASEMSRRAKLLEHDIKHEQEKPVSEEQKKAGKIAFWVLLGVIAAIAVVYCLYHIVM